MTAMRAMSVPRGGKMRASETTKPFESAASDVTRASQFIHPVSNPMKSPNAVFAYKYAPPGSLKWLAASAKQSTSTKTGTAKINGAHSEKGPSSLYDSVGSRKTPLPTTALMHIATKPQNPTARTSFSVELSCMCGDGFHHRDTEITEVFLCVLSVSVVQILFRATADPAMRSSS